jgi:hypothetical protein
LLVAAVNEGLWAPWIGLMGTFLILLYPDGTCPPNVAVGGMAVRRHYRRSDRGHHLHARAIDEGPVPGTVNPLGWRSAEPVLDVVLFIFLPAVATVHRGVRGALVRRFRRSAGVERLQLKWLATAGAWSPRCICSPWWWSGWTTSPASSPAPGMGHGGADRVGPVLLLLPAAIGIAILRYRLYDIDVVINRALVYSSLTAMLGGVYLGLVLLLQLCYTDHPGVRPRSRGIHARGRRAVSSRPRRIQGIVDRRFYPSRYDAARTIDAFAGRLRHESTSKRSAAVCRPQRTTPCSRRMSRCGYDHEGDVGSRSAEPRLGRVRGAGGDCRAHGCDFSRRPAEGHAGATLETSVFVLVMAVFPLVGLLIVRRQPRNTVGWLLLGVGLVWAVGGATDNYARYGLLINPGSLPEPAVAAVINAVIWAPAIGLMGTFVILLYPDGRLPSQRWRWVAWLSGATVAA